MLNVYSFELIKKIIIIKIMLFQTSSFPSLHVEMQENIGNYLEYETFSWAAHNICKSKLVLSVWATFVGNISRVFGLSMGKRKMLSHWDRTFASDLKFYNFLELLLCACNFILTKSTWEKLKVHFVWTNKWTANIPNGTAA